MKKYTFIFLLLFLRENFASAQNELDQFYSTINQQCDFYGIPTISAAQDKEKSRQLIEEIIFSCAQRIAKKIVSLIERAIDPDCLKKIKPKKLLISGPAGVGKSTLAKQIALLSGRPFKFIRSTDLLTKYQHSGPENLMNEIRSVLALNCPYVIIIDEINCLIDGFNKEQNTDKETATALWLAIDECCARDNILFIGTTNELKNIPGPLETRFKNHKIEIPLPNSTARKRIMTYYLKDIKHWLSTTDALTLSSKMDGLSGREIEEMVTESMVLASERNHYDPIVTRKDLEKALYEIKPHGKIVSACIDLWKNRKEYFIKSLPHLIPIVIAIAGMALTYYLWATPNETVARGLELQEEGMKLQKKNENAQVLNSFLQAANYQSSLQNVFLQQHTISAQSEINGKVPSVVSKDDLDLLLKNKSFIDRTLKELLIDLKNIKTN